MEQYGGCAMGIYDREYYRRETSGSLWLSGRAPLTMGLVVANVLVFLACFAPRGVGLAGWLVLEPSLVFRDFQIWRLVTAAFCHAGVWHLLGNMLFLWWFGRELERMYGSREFAAFYLGAAVFSSLAWAGTSWLFDQSAVMLGASGAVTAVTVLFTLYNPRHTILLYGFIPIEMRWMVLIYLGIDFYGLVGPAYSPIAHMAHLGGAAYAVLYKYADLRLSKLSRPRLLRPRLRVVRAEPPPVPATGAEIDALGESLEHRLDEVLQKISRQGPQSLNQGEREILDEASRRLRGRRT